MPISVNLAVTTWFPLEFNIHVWKLFSLAIIFIVTVFNENHAGNNAVIANHQYRNCSTTTQSTGDSYKQVGKQVNNQRDKLFKHF